MAHKPSGNDAGITSTSRRKFLVAAGATGATALAGCTGNGNGGGDGNNQGTDAGNNSQSVSSISGAGSSFVAPIVGKWAQVYHKQNGLEVNYRSIGSGGGQKNLIDKTIDFAGSDAPLSTDQYNSLQSDGGVVHVPETLGAIVPVFKLPNVGSLKITGPVLAEIFLGDITKWNDPKLAKLNPDANLPDQKIVVAHRSDASGTSYGYTGYLNAVSDKWKSQVGQSKSPDWPTGIGGKGNEGVASIMKKQSYAIGYVELTYATENNIDMFTMQNKAGKWVDASLEGVSSAAAGALDSLPKGDGDWSSVGINDAPGDKTWPISTFTYIIMYKDFGKAYGGKVSEAEAKATVKFIDWMIHDGQQYSNGLKYPKLPDAVVKLDEKTLKSMTYNGKSLL